MSMRRSLLALVLLSFAAWSFPAAAHISLDRSTTHGSRYGDGEIKEAPCGRAGGTRGTNIYTYAPGETITVSISEFVPHPSYFRIAFDQDGDDDFVDPVSIKPIDPNRPCPYDQYDQCGLTDSFQDFYNTPAVLPGMDNLDPHLTATFGQEYSWQVTLPNVECDNCTLQIIQVMQDVIHGAYNTDKTIEPSYIEDVYHQCIDLVLTGNPGTLPDAGGPIPGSGGGANDGGAGASSEGDDEGSCSCSLGVHSRGTATEAAFVLLLLGLIVRRRNR